MYNEIMLKDGERYDDLQFRNLKLIQKEGGYTFTSDAVLIANHVRAYRGERVVDLGTGSGVIAILVAAKTPCKEVVGIEIQPRLADMASRSVEVNGLSDRVKILNCDMKDAPELLGRESFDVVVSNPPYMIAEGESDDEVEICKREFKITLREVIRTATKLLKYGGNLYMILKSERLTDLISFMRLEGVEPKRLIPVQPTIKKDIDTVIVEGKKAGKPGLVMEKPLIVFDENGEYTLDAKRLYDL